MAAILHQLDQRRLIDTNGIADGASIYFYTTGTLTPAPVYTTAALSVEHSSPIVVAAGAAVPDIWLDSTVTYRRRIVYPDGSVDDTDPYTSGVLQATDLASTDDGMGDDLVAHSDDFADTTVRNRINILSATARPAMAGIFSSGSDQRAALLDFITTAAADGKTIEWGPIDVSLDVETATASKRGLVIPTGSRWVMHPNTRIRAVANDAENYEIINIKDASDIVIEGCGAKIIGDRDDHTGTTGEWGMGVNIQGASDVTIRDLQVEDCWGDGLYIGSTATQAYCENIVLERVVVDNCRRNGLSLVSAKGFLCDGGQFLNTNGTAPKAGVDIEPNASTQFLQDVLFRDCLASGNDGVGFKTFLSNLDGTANPVSIRLIDCEDRGAGTSGFSVESVYDTPGRIELIRPRSYAAGETGIALPLKTAAGAKVVLDHPYIEDWNQSETAVAAASAAIAIFAASGNSGTDALGGVDIIKPEFKWAAASPPAGGSFYCRDLRSTTPNAMRDIQIIEPIDLAGLLAVTFGVSRFDDPLRKAVRALGNAAESVSTSSAAVHYVTPKLTSSRAYTLGSNHSVGREMIFEIGADSGSNQARFTFDTGHKLFPDTLGASNYIYSATKGSRLKVRLKRLTLAYDGKTGSFTAGLVVTGGTSGATATIKEVIDNGDNTGTLYFEYVAGTFQDNETITDSSTGSATVNGTLGAEWTTVEKIGTWATA